MRSRTNYPGRLCSLTDVYVLNKLFSGIGLTGDTREGSGSISIWMRNLGTHDSNFFIFELYTHLILNINS